MSGDGGVDWLVYFSIQAIGLKCCTDTLSYSRLVLSELILVPRRG